MFADSSGNLWVAYVDHDTGYFYPPDGQAMLVDTNVVTAQKIGNGPEFMVSRRGSSR